MATMQYVSGSLLILVLGMGGIIDRRPAVETQDFASLQESKRQNLQRIYTTEIGVHEATGHNDGKRVEEYLRYCGLGAGYNWCSAFTCWCLGNAGLENPRNPWAPAMFPAKRVVWERKQPKTVMLSVADCAAGIREKLGAVGLMQLKSHKQGNEIHVGDVFGLYFLELKRIGHCGFIDACDGKWITTVEGNSDNAVVRKRRLVSTVYKVADWIN